LSPRPAQRAAFEKQLAIAVELGMPLFLHQRDAHDDFLTLLKSARDQVPAAVVHCFTDDRRALFDYLDLDCHVGITGWICDERRGTQLRELVRSIPANRLMLETDAPYLLPRDIRPQPSDRRNEPMYLAHICEAVARERGETPEAVAEQTSANARAFFGIER
jgi:TatD DNase family protein